MPVSARLRDNDVLWYVVCGYEVKAANIAADLFNVCVEAIAQVQGLLGVLDQRECALVALPASLQCTDFLMTGRLAHSEQALHC